VPLAKAAQYGYLSARCRILRSQLIEPEAFRHLAASRSIGELASALNGTLYASFITDVSPEGIHRGLSEAFAHQRNRLIREVGRGHRELFTLFFETKYDLTDQKMERMDAANPEEAFLQVDTDYTAQLKKSIRRLPRFEQRQLKKMVGSYFDLLNLYNLVKLRLLYGRSVAETLAYMLPYAERFDLEALAGLCDAATIEQLSERIEPLLGEGFGDYETFRKVLYRYHRQELLSVWSGYPFSIALPFSLLRLMEVEISDLRAITEGVSSDLGSSEIVAMTVGA